MLMNLMTKCQSHVADERKKSLNTQDIIELNTKKNNC